MKSFFVFVFATTFFSAGAQDSIVSISRFEQWSTQPGKLMKTEVHSVGKVNFTSIDLVRTTDLSSGKSAFALRLQSDLFRNTNIVSPAFVYIDSAELENTITALKQFAKHMELDRPELETTLSYYTEDGVQIGYYNMNGTVNLWFTRLYQYEKKPYTGSTFSFNKRRLPELIRVFEYAMEVSRKQSGTLPAGSIR